MDPKFVARFVWLRGSSGNGTDANHFRISMTLVLLITVLVFVIQSTIAMPTIGKPGTYVIRFEFDHHDLEFVLSSLCVFSLC